jgi:fused signal recognition particle receptor
MQFSLFKSIRQKVEQIVTGRGKVDEELFEELEVMMIQADLSVHATTQILDELKLTVQQNRLATVNEVVAHLKSDLVALLSGGDPAKSVLTVAPDSPTLYLVVGVNGVGKTTSIAKLTNLLQNRKKKVVLAAADTFRAAAIDQLQIWADRLGTDLVKHRDGADPSAVVFDAIKAARARGADYVIADTAGRLHNRANLMEELKKINRIAERELGRPADEVLLVLDANTGQNAINQARQFLQAIPLTGIILTKLDSTAKGGIVFSIADELHLPIKLVGLGEQVDKMTTFDPSKFVDSLLQ